MKGWLRRLRGALGNGVVWAVSWVAGGTAVLGFLHLTGLFRLADPSEIFSFFVPVLGMTGLLTGLAFSAYLPFAFRDQDVVEIRSAPFVLGGAVIAGLICALIMLLPPLGPEIAGPTRILIASELWSVLSGGLTAGATLKLAQRAPMSLAGAAVDQTAGEQDRVVHLPGRG